MSIKQLSKPQKTRLCLGAAIMVATFIYACFSYPRLLEFAYGMEAELTLGQRLFFQWSWLITLLPLVLGTCIFFTYKNKEKRGTALLTFSIVSSIALLAVVCYLNFATRQPVLTWEEGVKEVQVLNEGGIPNVPQAPPKN